MNATDREVTSVGDHTPETLHDTVYPPCDLRQPGQLEAVFDATRERWGKLDFLLHSVAFAPREDLHAWVVDCSAEGFALAMDVSCHSFIRMTKLAELENKASAD